MLPDGVSGAAVSKTGCKVGAKGNVDFCQFGVDIWQIVVDVDGGGLFGF
jgi:hypothetical protein